MSVESSPLVRAIERLRAGLARYEQDTADEQIRDGLIQRFEFTYELSHRVLRRYLRDGAASAEMVDRADFGELIRAGNAAGLLRGAWPVWRRFREMRARTSHAYDVVAARAVVAKIPMFLDEVTYFCDALEQQQA